MMSPYKIKERGLDKTITIVYNRVSQDFETFGDYMDTLETKPVKKTTYCRNLLMISLRHFLREEFKHTRSTGKVYDHRITAIFLGVICLLIALFIQVGRGIVAATRPSSNMKNGSTTKKNS